MYSVRFNKNVKDTILVHRLYDVCVGGPKRNVVSFIEFFFYRCATITSTYAETKGNNLQQSTDQTQARLINFREGSVRHFAGRRRDSAPCRDGVSSAAGDGTIFAENSTPTNNRHKRSVVRLRPPEPDV